MDKKLLTRILRESTLSEAKPVGLALTDKVKGEDKKENDAYYKEVEKKMSDYEKASTSSSPDAIEEPKFNYDYEDEVEYHEDMEIRNGMEMLNYERKPSEKFSQRAKEAIEGSSNMGNNPEWANVYPEQQGFTGPEFGKKLVKTIERSKAKRDAATPTFDQFGDDIEEKNVGVNKTKSAYKPKAIKKPVAIQESKKIKINEALTEKGLELVSKWIDENGSRGAGIKLIDAILRKKIGLSSSDLADSSTFMNGLDAVEEALDERDLQGAYNIAKETAIEMIDEEGESYGFMEENINNDLASIKAKAKQESRDCECSQHVNEKSKGVYTIEDFYDADTTVASFENGRQLNENNNKSEIKESTKMKRLKFKKPFNGIETALRVIPESYRVDNKVFEMTDGNENYKIRWEGSLTEGKAVVLTAYDKTLVKEDMAKIKHLMGFKSQDTLGNLKGAQRIEENKVFADMLKKTRTLMTEGEANGKYDDGDGKPEKCDFVPCGEKPVSEAISWEQIMDGDKINQLQVVPGRSFSSPEELENATMTIIGKLDDKKVKLKGNKDGKEYHFDIADLRTFDDPQNRVNFS